MLRHPWRSFDETRRFEFPIGALASAGAFDLIASFHPPDWPSFRRYLHSFKPSTHEHRQLNCFTLADRKSIFGKLAERSTSSSDRSASACLASFSAEAGCRFFRSMNRTTRLIAILAASMWTSCWTIASLKKRATKRPRSGLRRRDEGIGKARKGAGLGFAADWLASPPWDPGGFGRGVCIPKNGGIPPHHCVD
ncbi:hypothetical protein Hsar01_03747 [Haloferula sargassicola]|uniref:Uncharacterized protein n=1 Tax=Haloferula sargassicola TaxID=490096 RepID=A0ABP9UXB2_9BACT